MKAVQQSDLEKRDFVLEGPPSKGKAARRKSPLTRCTSLEATGTQVTCYLSMLHLHLKGVLTEPAASPRNSLGTTNSELTSEPPNRKANCVL